MAVTPSTVSSEAFSEIYSLLNNNLTDPASHSRSKFVFSSFPEEQDLSSIGYPLVVITPANVSYDGSIAGLTAEGITFEVDVLAKSSKQADDLQDNVVNLFRNNRQQSGLRLLSVESSAHSTIEHNEEQIHAKTIVLTCAHNQVM